MLALTDQLSRRADLMQGQKQNWGWCSWSTVLSRYGRVRWSYQGYHPHLGLYNNMTNTVECWHKGIDTSYDWWNRGEKFGSVAAMHVVNSHLASSHGKLSGWGSGHLLINFFISTDINAYTKVYTWGFMKAYLSFLSVTKGNWALSVCKRHY